MEQIIDGGQPLQLSLNTTEEEGIAIPMQVISMVMEEVEMTYYTCQLARRCCK